MHHRSNHPSPLLLTLVLLAGLLAAPDLAAATALNSAAYHSEISGSILIPVASPVTKGL